MANSNNDTAETQAAFSPNALLSALGNSLTSPMFSKVVKVKGIFKVGKGVNYNGAFYDGLKDEYGEMTMTLVVPERLRNNIKEGQLIEALGYLSKRFQPASAKIDLLLTMTDLLDRKDIVVNDAEVRALELIRRKAKSGFRDVDSFIRGRFFEQKPVSVTILIGTTAIVDNDIKYQLREALPAYRFNYIRINLAQATEIMRALKENDSTDILVIARGGGENMQVFDNPAISEIALTLQPIFLTALGHSSDEPLLQKVADRAFITPTALGQYFHELYNKTIDDLNNSKTKLIDDLSKQIELGYRTKIQDMTQRLAESAQFREQAIQRAELEINALLRHAEASKKKNTTRMAVLIVVIVLLLLWIFRR